MGTQEAFTEYWVIYNLKFHCELNHIKIFYCDGKNWTCQHYKYILDNLREDVSKTLN